MADADSIPNIPHGPSSSQEVIPEFRVKRALPGEAQNKTKQKLAKVTSEYCQGKLVRAESNLEIKDLIK